MKRAMLTVVLATALVVIGRTAQAPPNLSGTWRPQNSMGGQVNPFEFTITQTADSVTIRTPLSNPESVTLKLNGETPVQIAGGQRGMAATSVGGAPRKPVITGDMLSPSSLNRDVCPQSREW